jgi:hypothetical protein
LEERIIQGAGDGQIVHEEAIGEASQPLDSLLGCGAEGFAAAVAAGGHQGPTHKFH